MITQIKERGLVLPNIGVKMEKQMYPPPAGSVLYLSGYPPLGATIIDHSGQGNHGTITDATWTRLASGLWCLSFDGTGDNVALPAAVGLNSAGTIKIWARTTNKTLTNQYIYTDCQDGSNELILTWVGNLDAGISFNGYDNAAYQFQLAYANTNLANNTWYHIVACFQDNDARLYVNGVLRDSDNTVNMDAYTHVKNHIGYYSGDTAWAFNGNLALPTVMTSVWSDAQALNNFNQERHFFGI